MRPTSPSPGPPEPGLAIYRSLCALAETTIGLYKAELVRRQGPWRGIDDLELNALAETTIGLYKAELVRRQGPWRGIDDLELATLEYIDWFNHRRLHSAIGDVPPAEYEAAHYHAHGQLTPPVAT